MKSKINIIILVALISYNAFGQINESDSLQFKFSGNLLFNYQEGNVNLFRITTHPTLLVALEKEKNFVFKSQNRLMYQEFSKIKTDLEAENQSFLYYQPSNKWYPFIYTFAGTNFRRKINFRLYTGAGVTYQIINTSNFIFKLAGSLSYDFTEFSNQNFNRTEFNNQKYFSTIRPVLYSYGKYIINKNSKIQYMYYYQPVINDLAISRHFLDVWLDFAISKKINFTTHYLFNYESLVVQNVQTRDQIMSLGISYHISKF